MAVKLLSLRFYGRIPELVSLKAFLSSISCANSIQSNPETYQNQSDSSEFEAKIQFLKNKLHPDSLVSALDSTPDLNSSIKLFKWASLQNRFNHTADTYYRIILKLGMSGNVEEMEGFCNEMVNDKCLGFGESLLALIDSFVKNHRLDEALRVLYVMNLSSFKPSIGLFNKIMSALLDEKKDFKDVLFVYKEMVKSGILPNIDTMNYLLDSLFEAGRVDTALDQYRRLHKKGCNPNSRTFEILISNLVARNRVEESIILLDDMVQFGCEPDSSFYIRVIPIFCRLQNLEVGMRLFKMMGASNISPDSATYAALINCLCEYLHLDDATKLFEEMIDCGLSPEEETFVDIIKGFCKSNKFTEAIMFLEEKNVIDTSPYNTLLEAFCATGNFPMAKSMFDSMFRRNIIDASSWNILIRFFCENAAISKALEFLCRMIVSLFVPDSATYSALIIGNCRMGKFEDALQLFSTVRSKCWVLDSVSYAELVECLCQRENTQEAAKVFRYMSRKGCTLRSTSFDKLIEETCASGKADSAVRLLSVAYYSGTVCFSSTYNSIMRGLFKMGHINDLLVLVSKMMVVGCVFDEETYCLLIQSTSAFNRVADSLSFFNLMLREGFLPGSDTLVCLLRCLAKYSRMHLILPSLDKLSSECEILDSVTYNLLVNGLWGEGYKSEAKQMLDLMLEKGWIPNVSTHALLMGSVLKEEIEIEKSAYENTGTCDEVSSILAEGLVER
ncbi:Pentatricopeptide repeat-containing protein [Abeliophyllum distichum]|uniref:Pentatricopeptide repeat-containing protein n=1 Tax=Abeliophyllum distichum TaxID=126358 RepID=A0ABD1P9U2_9LAMI